MPVRMEDTAGFHLPQQCNNLPLPKIDIASGVTLQEKIASGGYCFQRHLDDQGLAVGTTTKVMVCQFAWLTMLASTSIMYHCKKNDSLQHITSPIGIHFYRHLDDKTLVQPHNKSCHLPCWMINVTFASYFRFLSHSNFVSF
jgi:hypothetical protein